MTWQVTFTAYSLVVANADLHDALEGAQQQRPTADRHEGLGTIIGDRRQAASTPRSQDDGLHAPQRTSRRVAE